ncbi:MAG: alpha/beta hydrolase [Rhodanobacter sp.]
MNEAAFRFGRADHLVGVIGTPAGNAGGVGVIILNAGLVHRIGPFRLHVDLSRRLNVSGYPTLRFDLSTLGDSGASGALQSREQQTRADMADAMALLRTQAGCTQFVLVGLCSGAENAYLAACTEPSVAGVVFLDGYAYRTLGFRLRHYLPRLMHPARIARFMLRHWRAAKESHDVAEPSFGVQFPPQQQVRTELASMLKRGLRLCFIYSGGVSAYFNHRRQFRECFGRDIAGAPGVSVSFLPEVDHTYILLEDRQRLIGMIDTWLREQLPATAAQLKQDTTR